MPDNSAAATVIAVAKWIGGIVAAMVAALLVGVVWRISDNLSTLNTQVIQLQAWRSQMDTANSVPRQEIDLRERIVAGQIEQLRVRVESLERTQ
jgi:hypothetical protein